MSLMMQNTKVYCLWFWQECSLIIQCIFPTSDFNVLYRTNKTFAALHEN